MPTPQFARSVIDRAIRENMTWQRIAYLTIIAAVAGAVAAMVQALLTDNWLWTVGSGIAGIYLWPAFHYTLRARNQNIALRMFEVPLSEARTSEEAAKVLGDFFTHTFRMKKD